MRTDLQERLLQDKIDAPRGEAWELAKTIHKLKREDTTTFYSPSEQWIKAAASTIKHRRKYFVVDSGAIMPMVSNRETLNEAEFETVRASKNPTVLMTANGEMLAKKVAKVYVRELDLFVTVMLLEETPTVLSLVKPCEDLVCTFQWISSQKPHLIRHGKRLDCNMSHFVPCVAPGLSASSSSTTPYLHLFLHHLHHRILYFDVRRDAENPVPEKSGSTKEEK